MIPVPYCSATLRAMAALSEDDGEGEEVESVVPLPLPLIVELESESEEDELLSVASDMEEEVVLGRLLLAFLSPQVTERQPVRPSRSLGWLSTQLAIHWAQMKDGMVWS